MTNNVDFHGTQSLTVQNGGSLAFTVSVISPTETGKDVNLVLELLGSSCSFVGSGGRKLNLSFASKGFMQKTLCNVNVQVRSDKSGDTTTTLKVYSTAPDAPGTQNSNSPEIPLKIMDGASV